MRHMDAQIFPEKQPNFPNSIAAQLSYHEQTLWKAVACEQL